LYGSLKHSKTTLALRIKFRKRSRPQGKIFKLITADVLIVAALEKDNRVVC